MKYAILIIILFLVVNLSAQDMPGMKMPLKRKAATQQTQKVIYTCPMHPEIKMDKPGNCPKCGMKLVKKITKVPSSNAAHQMHNGVPMERNTLKEDKETTMPGMQMANQSSGGDTIKLMDKSMDIGDMKMGEGKGMQMDKTVGRLMGYKLVENPQLPRTVRYDLYIKDTTVTFGKKSKRAIAVNGQIPMPTLTFTEGDTAEIHVHNELNEETSLHWHGLFLPNRMDGVPFITQMPIKPHTTYLYKFPIIQHGTHWYHSHTKLQEQIGMYGALILNKRQKWNIPTIPMVLSDWTDMKPEEVNRRLHNATDWFAIEKGTTQSYAEAVKTGHFKTKVTNEWKRMTAMDVSDVAYDRFLINGKAESEQPQFKAGDKVRLRIANGSSSSYFWLTWSGGKITVVANDGNDVEPVEVDRLIIGVSETYDVVVTIPDNKSYEFLATPEDRTGHTSLWLGGGAKVPAVRLPKLKYFAGMKMMNDMMDMNGNLIQMEGMNMQNQEMDMNTVMYPEITGPEPPKNKREAEKMQKMNDNKENEKMSGSKEMQTNNGSLSMAGMDMDNNNEEMVTLNYGMLRATGITTLPPGPVKELRFNLTGNMSRYVWSIDNKTLAETDKILIKKGENVRIIIYNNTMMRHPMHLHGHDFRLLNGQGEYAPLKNVLDIMPMEKDTFEFAANASGDWFFHCHILYHMMSGMGRVFSYENSLPNPEIPNPKWAQRKLFWETRMPYSMGRVGLESNGTEGEFVLANTRWKANTLWHLGTSAKTGYESETMVGRYLGRMQRWFPYVGYDYHYKKFNPKEDNIFGSDAKNMFGQVSNKDHRNTIIAGIAYTLPMLVIADARIDGEGKFRFQLSRADVVVTSRVRFNFMVNTDKEYAAGLRYILTKWFALSTHYDSDMGLGAGITVTY